MEKFIVKKDIPLLCVTATSFPEGVLKAHEKLHTILATTEGRIIYGISCPNQQGVIVYRAAAEQQYDGEAEQLKCESLTLKKGNYMGTIIHNFHDDVRQIGKVFQKLIADPNIDPDGFCIEWYINENDVQCMVRLNSSNN